MTDIQNLKTNEQKIGMTRNYQTPEIQMQFGMNWQRENKQPAGAIHQINDCLLYTSPSPRDRTSSRMPSSA